MPRRMVVSIMPHWSESHAPRQVWHVSTLQLQYTHFGTENRPCGFATIADISAVIIPSFPFPHPGAQSTRPHPAFPGLLSTSLTPSLGAYRHAKREPDCDSLPFPSSQGRLLLNEPAWVHYHPPGFCPPALPAAPSMDEGRMGRPWIRE
jgi:hypothetical protein